MIRVIVRGPTLVGDSNRFRKNDSRCAMTNRDVLCNILVAKRANTRQVPITWTDSDDEGVMYWHEDTLVTSAVVAGKKFVWILVDIGSSVDVLFKSTLDEMRIMDLKLQITSKSLKGFGGKY